jgi:hypothetical protein
VPFPLRVLTLLHLRLDQEKLCKEKANLLRGDLAKKIAEQKGERNRKSKDDEAGAKKKK